MYHTREIITFQQQTLNHISYDEKAHNRPQHGGIRRQSSSWRLEAQKNRKEGYMQL